MRPGQPDGGHAGKRRDEVVRIAAKAVVKHGDRLGTQTQPGIGIEDQRLDRHGADDLRNG